jgi:hypothetical protein
MFTVTTPGFANITKEIRSELAEEIREFSNELLLALRSYTPIAPKNGGRARQGWSAKQTDQYKVVLTNNVPYIERLEDNYSTQTRGRGIINPSVDQTIARRQRRNTR